MVARVLRLLLASLLVIASSALKLTSAAQHTGPWPLEQNLHGTTILTDANFAAKIKEHKWIMVVFYAPWCPHCKQFVPKVHLAEAKLLAQTHSKHMGQVACSQNLQLKKKFGITNYPTLLLFHNGKKVKHLNPSDHVQDIVDLVNANIPPIVSVKSAVQLKLAQQLKKIAAGLPSAASLTLPQIPEIGNLKAAKAVLSQKTLTQKSVVMSQHEGGDDIFAKMHAQPQPVQVAQVQAAAPIVQTPTPVAVITSQAQMAANNALNQVQSLLAGNMSAINAPATVAPVAQVAAQIVAAPVAPVQQTPVAPVALPQSTVQPQPQQNLQAQAAALQLQQQQIMTAAAPAIVNQHVAVAQVSAQPIQPAQALVQVAQPTPAPVVQATPQALSESNVNAQYQAVQAALNQANATNAAELNGGVQVPAKAPAVQPVVSQMATSVVQVAVPQVQALVQAQPVVQGAPEMTQPAPVANVLAAANAGVGDKLAIQNAAWIAKMGLHA